RRADPARRAFATGLLRAKLHGVAGHPSHVHSVVEYDDTSMAQQRPDGRERFVIDQHVELRSGDVGPQWTPDLHGANWPAGCGASAVVIQQLPQAHAESAFDEPAPLDVPR